LDKDTEIHIGRLDERLRLAKCSIKTEHYLPPGGKMEGRFVVGTRCNGNKRWAIYVPVKRIRYDSVVVTTRPVRRGETIADDQVEMRRTALNDLHSGYILRLDKVLGKTVKSTLKAGTVLHSGNLKAAIAVRRGEKVNILAKKGPILVRMTGKALMDGAEGQKIRVKNQLSDRIIEGTVTYDGNIRVGL
jgi:flagella basal body P-ring formation protein FlgA